MELGDFALAFPCCLCDKADMEMHSRMRTHPVCVEMPEGFRLADVEVRLVTPLERPVWDALMDERHYLGFHRLAARGLRYVAVWRGRWLALAGWQGGAFKCRPRDRWIGWKPAQQFERLDLVANNTRFLVMSEPGVLPNLASFFLAAMTRRLGADWLAVHGHRVLVAETFCDPQRFTGAMYRAAGWRELGSTRGYARANGRYSEPHGRPKRILVRSLHRRARQWLARPEALPPTVMPPRDPSPAARDPAVMRSLYAELAAVEDYRRAQGRKHTIACVLTVHILATLANMKGCLAAAQFAQALSQEELAAIGAWRNPKTGRREPVAKSTIHRVVQSVDPEALEAVLRRYSGIRLPQLRALAGDGKRIRGANRNGSGHHETVALVDHASGAPVALLGFTDEGGERAAMHDLLERTDIRGRVVTLDALHTVRDTARLITKRCGADHLMTVKANAPETFAILEGIDWDRQRHGWHAEQPVKAHGRLERRTIDVMTPLRGTVNYPGIRQIARVQRYREKLGPAADGTSSTETVYLITSLDAQAASPADLLALNRGHWAVENSNHRVRDTTLGEDACLTRTGNGPLNRAGLNSIALAVVFANRRRGETLASTFRRFQLCPGDAIRAVCDPPPTTAN